MSDDPLKRILQAADAAAGEPPEMPADLAQRVRILAGRRRRVRFGVSVAAAIVLAVGMTSLWSQTPAPSRPGGDSQMVRGPQEPPDVESIRAEIEQLRREAEMRLAVARRTQEILTQMRRAEEFTKQEVVPDPIARARREVEKAAYTLVYQADRMCRELDLCDSAAVKYQRVVELFPDTRWAAVARQRLDEIKKTGDV
ncbi:MAG: hypothetical protein ACE5I3_15915 [Phycisphaerae bacterium]